MELRLTAPSLDFWVDVRLRSFGGRWIAVAHIAGDQELGTGKDPWEALVSALSTLGPEAASALCLMALQPPAPPG